MDKNLILISGGVVVKDEKSKVSFFLIRQPEDGKWELPKTIVRRGESSVRAVLRTMGEKGAMTTSVLAEAGRAGGVTTTNGKTLPQRHLYYLMLLKSYSNEPMGFHEYEWLEYSKAVRKLSSKRERSMLKTAKKIYLKWKKERQSSRRLLNI